ncbi:hypothetical protein FRB99_007272 [Tulasnella sp. 403]|nr:hypothetical protein FRB99_007272 [Tulasnella sp. 403]
MAFFFAFLTLALSLSCSRVRAGSDTPSWDLVEESQLARCPYGRSYTLEAKEVDPRDLHGRPLGEQEPTHLELRFIGAGDSGCVYQISGGWYDPILDESEAAVVKTPVLDATQLVVQQMFNDEKNKLDIIGDLFTVIEDVSNGRRFLVTKQHFGSFLLNAPGYRHAFPKLYNTEPRLQGQCSLFMHALYDKIAKNTVDSARKYNFYPSDPNFRNYLWSDDLSSVQFVDWGRTQTVPTKSEAMKQAALDKLYVDFVEKLATKSNLPISICDPEVAPGLLEVIIASKSLSLS